MTGMIVAKLHNLECKKKMSPDALVHRPLLPKKKQSAEEMQRIIMTHMPTPSVSNGQ